jgi:hypothetical protein
MRVKIGDVLSVPLDNGMSAYAYVSTNPLVIFYRYFSREIVPFEEAPKLPVAFKVFVYNDVLKSGRWKRIGNVPPSSTDLKIPYMFKQDIISGKLFIHHDEEFADRGSERSATLEECFYLERAAVWDAIHVEERLNWLAAGKANKWGGEYVIDRSKLES